MNNGPISASAPNTSLTGAIGTDITFNTRYPFHKLDSTNNGSFEVIALFFNTEPPNPAPTPPFDNLITLRTLVYSYPHGYAYEPSTWFLISTDNFVSVLGSEGAWLIGDSTTILGPIAKFEIEVDSTNVNFYVDKAWVSNGTISPPYITGMTVSVRAYIFVEDLLGQGVPTHA